MSMRRFGSEAAILAMQKELTTGNYRDAHGESISLEEAGRLAGALVNWFNKTELTRLDVRRLLRIARNGFKFWYCQTCAELVMRGADAVAIVDPEWSHFQGVCEDDRMSYPGRGPSDLRCSDCRCYDVGTSRLPDAEVLVDGYTSY